MRYIISLDIWPNINYYIKIHLMVYNVVRIRCKQ